MANLFDTVQQNTQAAASEATSAPKEASEQNKTGQVQRLLQAKSGKAVGSGSTPRASNVAEQQANATGAAQGQQLAQQVQAGNTALATNVQQQGQAIEQQKEEQTFEAAKVESDFLRNEDAVLDQYLQGTKKLDLTKDKAKFEQIGFQMRLADQQYIDTLNREGKRARLDNDVAFRNEMARTVFSDELDMFHDNLDFRSAIFADKLDFNEKMAAMNIDDALQVAKMNANQANQNLMWAGVGTIVSAVTKSAGSSGASSMPDSTSANSNTSVSGGGVTGDTSLEGGFSSGGGEMMS